MPSPPWTTPDQAEFLESKLPDFLAAQRDKTTQDFWKVIYREFFQRWTDPQDEIPALTVPKKRKRQDQPAVAPNLSHSEWVRLRKAQINNWYNNRRNGASHRRRAPAVIIGSVASQPQRVLSEMNLYSKKYYDTRVRERVAEAWKAAGATDKGSRIVIINRCLSECWQAETDEIKAEIHQEYERLKALKDQPTQASDSTPKTPENYAAELVTMPDTIKEFLHQMNERTGYTFSIIGGGPDSNRPGRMRLLAFHEGVDRFGQKFGAAYASFKPNVMEPFQKFLYNVYAEGEKNLQAVSNNNQEDKTKAIDSSESIQTMVTAPVLSNMCPQPPPSLAGTSAMIEGAALYNALPNPATARSLNTFDPTKVIFDPLPQIPSLGTSFVGLQNTSLALTSNPPLPFPNVNDASLASMSNPPPQIPSVNDASLTSMSNPPPQFTSVDDTSLASMSNPPPPIPNNASIEFVDDFVLIEHPVPSTSTFNTTFKGNLRNIDPFDFSYDELTSAVEGLNEWEIPVVDAIGVYAHNLGTSTPVKSINTGTIGDSDRPATSLVAPSPAFGGPTGSVPHATDPEIPLGAPDFPASIPVSIPVSSAHMLLAPNLPPTMPVMPAPTSAPDFPPSIPVSSAQILSAPNLPPTMPVMPAPTSAPDLPPSIPVLSAQMLSTPNPSPTVPVTPAPTSSKPNFPPAVPGLPPHPQTSSTAPAPSVPSNPVIAGAAAGGNISNSLESPIIPPQTTLTTASRPSNSMDVDDIENVDPNTTTSSVEERSSRIRKPPVSKEVQPSAWLELAHTYLLKDLDDEKWKTCVKKWFEFESEILNAMDTNSRRIPAKGRPGLLSKWVTTRNYAAIPHVDEAVFAVEWLQWWNDMQPKWRKSSDSLGLPLQIVAGNTKDDLSTIRKGGPTGLVVVLIGLKWWAGRRTVDPVWHSAVTDIIECLSSTGTTAPSRKKRG